ncbi:tandem-95 repeat protein [Pseudoalteromonas xiamenensis]
MKKLTIFGCALAGSMMALAPSCVLAQPNFWLESAKLKTASTVATDNLMVHNAYSIDANMVELSQFLLNSSKTEFHVLLPMPDGQLARFKLTDSPVYASELQKKYPEFRTFEGVQEDNPLNRGRFDITPQGFHGMFLYNGQRAFIDPVKQSNRAAHISYFKANAVPSDSIKDKVLRVTREQSSKPMQNTKLAGGIKTYRVAIAAAGEYTAFHGGTKALALASMVTALNRINEVYKVDLGVQLELVANNDAIIFTDAATDPYNNTDDDLDANQAVVNDAIGVSNYDIGHVFNTGGGGVAYLGVVCDDNYKWGGMTGSSSPTNDPFVIDYVAHEMGHQFGGAHSFNGTNGACGNRSNDDAYEPGSGSTIMAYAGICGEENLQSNSDAFFHSHSVEQMRDYITTSAACGTLTPSTNVAPTVNAGSDYTIPANTAFKLTGTASDTDGDALRYSWEQFDLGTSSSSAATMVDDGSRPIFRAWMPTTEPVRVFPRLSDVLANKTTIGESYPTTSRTMNFKLIARDEKGNVGSDLMKVTTVTTAQRFEVTAPLKNAVWSENDTPTITWNVAGTTASPISCSNVDLVLAADGETFSTVLRSNTPNDGSETVNVPSLQSANARLMVRCSDNIFFAVNEGAFTISGKPNVIAPQIVGQKSIVGNEDNLTAINLSDLVVNDADSEFPAAFSLSVLSGTNYTVTGTSILPAADFNGVLSVPVTVNDGKFDSNQYTLTVTINAVNDAPKIVSGAGLVVEEDTSFAVSSQNFTITDVDSALSDLSINVLAGTNYSVSNNTVTPKADFAGSLSVNVVATDNITQSDVYQLNVDVTPVNDAPRVVGQNALSVAEDTAFSLSLSEIQVVDPDSASSQITVAVREGNNYTFNGNTIQPAVNFNGDLTVNVVVSDGVIESSLYPISVSVTPVNDAPVANSDSFSVVQGSAAVDLNVVSNDTDVDGDTLRITSLAYNGVGTVVTTESGVRYTPSANFTGTETINYTISDGNGAQASATSTITVTAKSSSSSSSGGGSLGFGAALLGLLALRRGRKAR